MKNQFRKGFRQNYKGADYMVKVIKLAAGEKILVREPLFSVLDVKKRDKQKH